MNSRVRHIMILWLSAVGLLAACSDATSTDEPQHPQKAKAISFSSYHGWPADYATRAEAAGSTIFAEKDSIIVYATHTYDKEDLNFTSNFMKKQIVKCDGIIWTYSPIKYWPKDGKLTFRGYYPATVKFDEQNHPDNGLIVTRHDCNTGFEPLYATEAIVNINNGELQGAVSDDGKLQLAFSPLLNKVNFMAKVDDGLFNDGDANDEYTECRFLLLSFKLWGFFRYSTYKMLEDLWGGRPSGDNTYLQTNPLDLTDALVKQKVSDVVPDYVYNPAEGYCTEYAVVIHEGNNLLNIFNKSLHLIPRNYNMRLIAPGFEIKYVVLTNKRDKDGHNEYKESGIITRVISLSEIFNDSGVTSTKPNYQLIKKLININLDFSIDAVTVTRNLEDYSYKTMF